jgi:hypothetical protein
VEATRSIAQPEQAPLSLRTCRRELAGHAGRRSRALGLGLAGAVGAGTWTLVALGGGQAGLTVAQAATVATRPAIVAVAEPRDDAATLPRLRAAGLPFPYWEDRFGWRATGARTDRLDGRLLTTVFYGQGRRRIAYTIVSGPSLAAGGGNAARAGTDLEALSSAGRQVITWLRHGHTCVLSGHGVPVEEMVRLATWRGHGRIPY